MATFKLILTAFTWILLVCCACSTKTENSKSADTVRIGTSVNELNGLYVGLEEMCWTDSSGKKHCYGDPTNPQWKWYHLSYLKFKGDSVFLEQNPLYINNKDTFFSQSDGAFYYYKGTYKIKDSVLTITFKMDHCDYCPHEMRKLDNGQYEEVDQYKQLVAVIRTEGLLIKNYLFKEKDSTATNSGFVQYRLMNKG